MLTVSMQPAICNTAGRMPRFRETPCSRRLPGSALPPASEESLLEGNAAVVEWLQPVLVNDLTAGDHMRQAVCTIYEITQL